MRVFLKSLAGAAAALMLAMPTALVEVVEAGRDERRQRTGLRGIVGHWTEIVDDGPAMKVDGAAWSGQSDATDIGAHGKALFGSVAEGFVANGVAPGAFPLAVWPEVADFAEGTLRVRFKLVGGRSDQTAGLVFNLRPTGEYLFVRYNTREGNVAIWGYTNGQRRVIARGPGKEQLPLGVWHELVVTVAGRVVTGAIDGVGTLSLKHELEAPIAGRVGLWTKRDSVTVFRDYRVTR